MNKLYEEDNIQMIADAIREKNEDLFNKNTQKPNSIYNKNTKVWDYNPNWNSSDYIQVNENTIYTLYVGYYDTGSQYYITFLAEDYSYISGGAGTMLTSNNLQFTTSSNVKYIVLGYRNDKNITNIQVKKYFKYKVSEMSQAILDIPSGTEINNFDIEITENGTYDVPEGYTGYGTITANIEGGATSPNVFMQLTEPTSKDGIWLQGDNQVDQIVATTEIYENESWNITKMGSIPPIPISYQSGLLLKEGNDIYLYGATNNTDKVYKYNTLTNEYTELANLTMGFDGRFSVVIGKDIYFAVNGSRGVFYKYNLLTDEAIQLPNIPYNFANSIIIAVGNNIYFFCGEPSGTGLKAYMYNTLTNSYIALPDTPYNQYHGSAVLVGDDIYLIGGYSTKKIITKFNIISNTYTALDVAIPFDYQRGTVIAVGSDIYLFGSYSAITRACKFNTLTNEFTMLPTMPYANYYGTSIKMGDDIYIFGGYNNPTRVQVYSLETKTFTSKSIVISQANTNNKTKIADFGIENAQFYYDNAYYSDSDGNLQKDIPTYNGNGTSWERIN